MPTWMTRTLATVPAAALSAVLWLLLLAAVPPEAAAVLLAVGAAGAVVLWRGAGEGLASRWFLGARRLRSDEAAALAEVMTRLCRARLGPPLVELLIAPGPGIAARGSGRRTVVLTTGLLDAVRDGQVPPEQATAVLAHAAGTVRAGLVRNDLALGWATLPYSALSTAATIVTWPLRRLPAIHAIWRWRVVPVVVAVVQQTSQGLLALAAGTAAIGALSYAVPASQQAWTATLIRAGDQWAADAGYGPALVAFLRRCPATTTTRTRLRTLTAATVQHAPTLGPVKT